MNNLPLRFMVFDKKQKTWLSPKPIEFTSPQFPSHQWNAYNIDQNTIVADMIVYDHDVYMDLYVDKLLNISGFPRGVMARFTIDLTVNFSFVCVRLMICCFTSKNFSKTCLTF